MKRPRTSTISKRRLHAIGSCCRSVRPPKYLVRVTGLPGRDARYCCITGYMELRTDFHQAKGDTNDTGR